MSTPITSIDLEGEKDLQDLDIPNVYKRMGPIGEEMKAAGQIKSPVRTITVLSQQDNLAEQLARSAREAKEMICVSSFLIQDSAFIQELLRASARGVRCYVLTAREQELLSSPEELGERREKIIEEHKKLLDSLAGKVLVRTSEHFHAKFALFDPKGRSPSGMMSTCNLVQDAMAGENVELALTLTSLEVKSFYLQFVEAFWQEAKHELLVPGKLGTVGRTSFGEAVPRQKPTHPATYKGVNGIRETAIRMIDNARRSITIGAWSYGEGHEVVEALEKKTREGIDVTVFVRPTDANTKALLPLLGSSCKIYGGDRMHAKFLLVDSDVGLVTTANFSPKGLDEGFEVGALLDTEATRRLESAISSLGPAKGWELCKKASLRDCPGNDVLVFDAGSGQLRKVTIEEEPFPGNVPQWTAPGLVEMREHKLDLKAFASPNTPTSKKLFRKARIRQKISPPSLPKDVSPLDEALDGLPVFQDKAKKMVGLSNWEDYDRVRDDAIRNGIVLVYASPKTLEKMAERKV